MTELRNLPARLALAALAAAALALPAAAADMNKVIHHAFPAAETGFDPQGISDLYSGTVVQAIFETLLTYDYLARPSKLAPMAAEALPQVTDDGKTYTFKVRKGVYFTPDPAFKGQKRELVANDFAYSLKRLVDPRVRSPYAFLVEGKIVGLEINRFEREAPQIADLFVRIPVKMTLNGTFHQIATFFYYVGKLTRIVNVENISLVSSQKDLGTATLMATCTATTFMYRPGGLGVPGAEKK